MHTTNSQRQRERESQWQATLDAAAAECERVAALETESMPRPGQTYLNRRTAEFPVEWLVIEADAERLRVVPVDDHPLVGSRDLELPPTALGGPMVTRCDLDAWLDADRFEPELRTGMLEPSLLEQVHHKRDAITADRLQSTLLESVVDGDPQYHRWRDGTLRRALKALATDPVSVSSKPAANDNLPHLWKLALVAASLISAVALGIWHIRSLDHELEAERIRVAELQEQGTETTSRLQEEEELRRSKENEVDRLKTELDEILATVDSAVESRTRELRDQVAGLNRRLASAFESATVTNIKRLIIDHRVRTTRRIGDPAASRNLTSFYLGGNPFVVLEVEVVDPEPYASYRVCMAPDAGGVPQCFDGLVIQDGKWLRLSVPRERLEADDYLVTVTGFGLGDSTELGERYDVRIQP